MSRTRTNQPGLTILEVVIAVAMLAGMASVILGAVSLMENSIVRDRHRLNAMEVAHRVVVQLIDDHTWVDRQPARRVQQGDYYYDFDYRVDVLYHEKGLDEEGKEIPSNRRATKLASESSVEERLKAQIHEITVTVYLERPDGSRSPQAYATLHRLYNPVMGEGERGIRWVMDLFQQQYGNL
jgi:hypothetical protein